jgi:hypothetical protein
MRAAERRRRSWQTPDNGVLDVLGVGEMGAATKDELGAQGRPRQHAASTVVAALRGRRLSVTFDLVLARKRVPQWKPVCRANFQTFC